LQQAYCTKRRPQPDDGSNAPVFFPTASTDCAFDEYQGNVADFPPMRPFNFRTFARTTSTQRITLCCPGTWRPTWISYSRYRRPTTRDCPCAN